MIERLFPKNQLHQYQGHPIAKWAFIFITAVTLGRSLVHIWAPEGSAQSIATIPLYSFSQQGAATVVLIFSLWGLSQLLIGVIWS